MACLVLFATAPNSPDATGDQGNTWKLAARPLTGGRDPVNEIQIRDPKVSRRHFMIAPKAGPPGSARSYVIREIKSRNGVRVNGERITKEHSLEDEDVIQVGSTRLLYLLTDEPSKEADALRRYRKHDTALREQSTELDEDENDED